MNNHALVIGVGADLPDTVTDAQGLAKLLTDPARCNFAPGNVTVLTETQATRDQILAALDSLAGAPADATVIVYFSGHGYLVESSTDESYFLMPYGYDVNRLAKTAIRGSDFAGKLAAIPAQRLLLLLDCCHAQGVGEAKAPGLTLTKAPLPPEAEQLFVQGSGRILIASSRANELSFAGKPYSLFTRALIECLCGTEMQEGDGYVRALDLALYASRKVAAWSKEHQHPTADTQRADNFIVAYYAAGAKVPRPLDLPPVDPEQIEVENQPAIRLLQQVTQSGGVNFGQDNQIKINGDVVGGDKVGGDKITVGNLSGNTGVAIGRGVQATVNTNVTHTTPTEFAQLITELRSQLATIKLADDEHTAVQQDLTSVEAQLAKSEPKLSLIKRGLNNIKDVIEAATDVGAAAATLSALVLRAIDMAQQLFK